MPSPRRLRKRDIMNTESTTNAPIDFDQLVDRCGDNPELARQWIGVFAAEVAGYVDELQSAFDLQEFEAVIATAFEIKNSAEMSSAHLNAGVADEIESAARSGDCSSAVAIFPELQTQVIRLQEWLENSSATIAS